MIFRLVMVFSFIFAGPTLAAEVMAWKVQLSRFTPFGLEAEEIKRCEKAPEPSVFFSQGDELWDISGGRPPDEKLPLDWIVWNATSRRIVAKGGWSSICQLHELLDVENVPVQARIKLEVFRISAGDSTRTENAVPEMSITAIGRSGQKFETYRESDGQKISLSGEVMLGKIHESTAHTQLSVECSLKNGPGLKIDTAFSSNFGDQLLMGKDFNALGGMDVSMTCTAELPDGSSLAEILLRQSDNHAKPFAFVNKVGRSPVSKGWLQIDAMPVDLFFRDEAAGANDPFAVTEKRRPPNYSNFPQISVPAFLAEKIDHPVLDLREFLEGAGVHFDHEGDFAAFDPIQRRIFIYSTDPGLLDSWYQVFMLGDGGAPKSVLITLVGTSETQLLARSGQRASLARSTEDGNVVRTLEVEAVSGENDELIDVTFKFHDEDGLQKQSVISNATLQNGTFLEVFAETAADDKKSALRLKVDVR